MGGKKGNRTKGNTRPSSSGRSAELLSASGVTGFVGFSGLGTDVAGFVASNLSDDVESTVDGDFRLVMKKTTKRDAVTKIKALQEMSALCENKDQIAVKGALPYWPRIFVKLAVDHDRRVREATHQANKSIVTKVKKDLAPYLKSMMGTWVASMCDPYAPAASAAQLAFQMCFPAAKQAEALDFCKEDIFQFISDILFQQSAKTLSDASTSTPEEMESKYIRLITCCFKGLKYFIANINDAHSHKIKNLLCSVLEANKFWKYANHKETEIRIAWYCFSASLCHIMPELATQYVSKLAPLTLGYIDETHPVVATLIWETLLHLLVVVDDCWSHINIQKAFFPKLWKTLRDGGKGNADQIFKNLLPLLSKMPKEISIQKPQFINEFFGNFKQGILNDKVQSSHSELKVVIQCYFECLRFVLLQSLDSSEDELNIRHSLIKEHLFPLVEIAIMNPDCKIQKPLFSELGSFLHAVESFIYTAETSENCIVLNDILHMFWTNLFNLYDKVLSSDDEPTAQTTINRFAQFFHHLHVKDTSSKMKKVAFSSDTTESTRDLKPEVSTLSSERTSNNILVKNTYKLCCTILVKFKTNPQSWYLNLLSEMVQAVPSKSLFTELMNAYSEEVQPESDPDKAVEMFINNVLLQWLANRNDLFGESKHVLPSIVGMILVACSCMAQADAFSILNELCKGEEYNVQEVLFSQIVNQETRFPKLYNWLKSDEVGIYMVSLATSVVHQNVDASEIGNQTGSWSLLKVCFTATKDFQPVIAVEYLNQILTILTVALIKQGTEIQSSTNIIVFICELAQSLLIGCLGCYQLSAVEELLVCLFQMSHSSTILPAEVQKLVQETWSLGTEQLVKYQGGFIKDDGFFCKAAKTIQDHLLQRRYYFSQLGMLNIVETNALCLLKTASKGWKKDQMSYFDKSCLVKALLDSIMPLEDELSEIESRFIYSLPDVIPFSLELPMVQILFGQDATIPPLLVMMKFLFKILDEFCLTNSSELPEDLSTDLKDASVFETTKEFMMLCLPRMCLVSTYCNYMYIQTSVPYKEEIATMVSEMNETLRKLLSYLDKDNIGQLLENLLQKGTFCGSLNLLVPQTIFNTFENNSTVECILKEHVKSFDNFESDNMLDFQVIQCLIPCLPETSVHELFIKITSYFYTETPLKQNLQNQYLELLICCLRRNPWKEECWNSLGQILTFLKELKHKSEAEFLCDVELSQTSENNNLKVRFITLVADLCSLILEQANDKIELWIWDFFLCTTCSWISTLRKSAKMLLSSFSTVLMAKNILNLQYLLQLNIATDKVKDYAPQLIDEWKDLYFPTIYSTILPLFFELYDLAKSSKDRCGSWQIELLFNSMKNSLNNLPMEDFLHCISLTPEAEPRKEEIFNLADKLASLLTSDIHPVQWCSHNLLLVLMPKLSELVSVEPLTEVDEKDDDYREKAPPAVVAKMLSTTGQIVDTMLADFHVEDCCLVQPYTDAYVYTLAYLFSWMHMLKIFSTSSSEIRSEYAVHLQNTHMLDNFLLNLFRLMPNNPFLNEHASLFSESFKTVNTSTASTQEVQRMACQVFLKTLSQLPALVRQWWNNQDKRTSDYVNKFTTTYVSSLISLEEVKSVQESKVQFNNMSVKARPMAREVVATYTMEEITIELVIKLPVNHPLGPVAIETGQRIGVGLTQWRHWMLQLTTFLTHQNGSILDGLSLWKRNIDKRFEGIEECMICFYVLHGATFQLPRLACRTCKKKFHSACLYKWFRTSQNASCPLCRNLF